MRILFGPLKNLLRYNDKRKEEKARKSRDEMPSFYDGKPKEDPDWEKIEALGSEERSVFQTIINPFNLNAFFLCLQWSIIIFLVASIWIWAELPVFEIGRRHHRRPITAIELSSFPWFIYVYLWIRKMGDYFYQ